MKVLLCLLSEQHIPNLLSVHHFHPDKLVLVESVQMKRHGAAENLLQALRLGGLDFPVPARCQILLLDRVDDVRAVLNVLEESCAGYGEAEWAVNITGGNKLMALATYQFFSKRRASVFYIERDRPRTLLPITPGDPIQCEQVISIGEFLAGYGYELRRSKEELDKNNKRDRNLWESACTLALNSSGADLIRFDEEQRAQAHKKGIVLTPQLLDDVDPIVRLELAKQFGLNPDGTISLDKTGGEFVTGGWLETFIWGLLERNAETLRIRDLQRGVKPCRPNDKEPNDMDVAFIHDLDLTMIECKTGKQDHGVPSDIFYKVDSVVRQSRALKAKAILATTSDYLFDPQRTGEFKRKVKELSELLNMRIVVREEIRELAKSPDDPELVRRLIFGARNNQ